MKDEASPRLSSGYVGGTHVKGSYLWMGWAETPSL